MPQPIDFSGFVAFDPEKPSTRLKFKIARGRLSIEEKIINDLGMAGSRSATFFYNPESRQIALKFHKDEANTVQKSVAILPRKKRNGTSLTLAFKSFADHFGIFFSPQTELPFTVINDPNFPADLLIDASNGKSIDLESAGERRPRRKGAGRPRKNKQAKDAQPKGETADQDEIS